MTKDKKTATHIRVLGVDPALRNCGYGVIEYSETNKSRAIDYGTWQQKRTLPLSSCLLSIFESACKLIEHTKPECCAVEGIIYVQSHKTAISMGAARGAVLLAAAKYGIPIFEYAPKRVKQAVTGRGAATKDQVAFLVRALLHLTETPDADAADALAIALTHAQSFNSPIEDGVRRI